MPQLPQTVINYTHPDGMRMCPESRWILDSLCSRQELPMNAMMVLARCDANIDKMVDDNINIEQMLLDMYNSWNALSSFPEKISLALQEILSINDTLSTMSSMIIDQYSGIGEFEDHVRDSVHRYNDDLARLSDLYQTLRNIDDDDIMLAFRIESEQKMARHDESMRRLVEENGHEYTSPEWDDSEFSTFDPLDVRSAEHIRNDKRKREKKAQRVVRKGMELFKSIFGEKDLRVFIKGDELKVQGRKFNYIIRNKHDIVGHTMRASVSSHIPYELKIYDTDWTYLTQGCVYFKQTPAIDQLVGVLTYIKHDMEDELLSNMNFFACSNEFYRSDDILPFRSRESQQISIESIGSQFNRTEMNTLMESVFSILKEHVRIPNNVLHSLREIHVSYDELLDYYFVDMDIIGPIRQAIGRLD